jgi:hypothetical protein
MIGETISNALKSALADVLQYIPGIGTEMAKDLRAGISTYGKQLFDARQEILDMRVNKTKAGVYGAMGVDPEKYMTSGIPSRRTDDVEKNTESMVDEQKKTNVMLEKVTNGAVGIWGF